MARAKKKSAKKPAKKTKAKAKAKKPAAKKKKAPAKKKPKAPPAKKKPPAPKPPKPEPEMGETSEMDETGEETPAEPPMAPPAGDMTPVEVEVAQLLKDDANGDIDNVFDIVDQLQDLDKRLPATSTWRPKFDAFVQECEQIMVESASGA